MKRTLLLSLAALFISGVSQAASINLVTNGSFEQGTSGIGSFSGWQTSLRDSATFVDSSGQTGTHAGQASDGLWSAYFGSTMASGGSAISQVLTTVAGQSYLLSFDLANDNGGQAARNGFLISIGGGTSTQLLVNLPSRDYMRQQLSFIASSSSTVLSLSGYNDGGYLQLDNVVVAPVPEPSSVVLLLIGGVALIHRRSKCREESRHGGEESPRHQNLALRSHSF